MKTTLIVLIATFLLFACADDSADSLQFGDGSGSQSVAGSLATFITVEDHLYALTSNEMKVFFLSPDGKPALVNSFKVSAETIFSYGNYLLLGTPTGMIIYAIENRRQPVLVSSVSHQTACDPVVAKNNYAYLTLRNGASCNPLAENQLLVYDITAIDSPVFVRSIQMIQPRGLGIIDNSLFVGEGKWGLKKFDINQADSPVFTQIYSEIEANDVIPLDNHLLVLGESSITQHKYESDSLLFVSQLK